MTTSTHHLDLLNAVAATLRAQPALAGIDVETQFTSNRPMAAESAQRVRLFLDQSVPGPIVIGLGGSTGLPVDWTTRLRAECTARGASGAGNSGMQRATVLAATCQQILLQNANTLGVEVAQIDPAPMLWTEDEADSALIACQAAFDIVHRTPATNLLT